MRTNTSNDTQAAPKLPVSNPGATPVVVALVVLAVFSPWLAASGSFLKGFLIAAQLVVCSIGVVRSFTSGTRPVSLVYFMFTFAWLGIGPAYQVSHDQMAWRDYTILANDPLVVRALAVNAMASTMVLLGSEFQRHRNRTSAVKLTRKVKIKNNGNFLWYYLAGAVILAPLAISAAGGLGVMFESRAMRGSALARAGLSLDQAGGLRVALVTILPSALSIAGAVLAGIRLRERREQRAVRAGDIVAMAMAVALLVLFCNPLGNSRFISSLAFGALIIALVRPLSVRAGRYFALIALLATAVIYPLAEVFRHGFSSTTSLRTGTQAFGSMDFDGFQQLANAIVFTDDFGTTRGHYTSSALLYFVPRSIWEGKATPASLDVAANRGYLFTNLSLPFPAEMYIEFGLIGMLIILFGLGILCSKTDSAWLQGGITKLGALAPLMAVSMLGFVRGPLGSLAPVYLTAIILVAIALTKRSDGAGPTEPILPAAHSSELDKP